MTINELWHSENNDEWNSALDQYWNYVQDGNMAIERELNVLDSQVIANMDENEFYVFLKNKYFKWKYTAHNRYATTTKHLSKYITEERLQDLNLIKESLFDFDKTDIKTGLIIAKKIHGLGPSGASGLLSILFPKYFGTIDQFAVKALRGVNGLPESELLTRMNPDGLTINNANVLIQIMKRKAAENNLAFEIEDWTPRKIDMILWTYGR